MKITLSVIHIDDGTFVRFSSYHGAYRVNGVDPLPSHLHDWKYYPEVYTVEDIEVKGANTSEQTHWELRDPEVEVKGTIPFRIENDQLVYCSDDEDFSGEMKAFCSLYKPQYRSIPGVYSPQEFEIKEELQYTVGYKPAVDFSIYKTGVNHYNDRDMYNAKPRNSTITQLLYPDIIQQHKPCFLSSHETYNIIRWFVKDNINPKVAIVTSDHDFCFSVSKKVRLEPYIHKTEITKVGGGSYKTPRFKSRKVEQKLEEIFEMTYSPYNWQKYTPIEGFSGKNQEDLKRNIDAYLAELIEYINLPVTECKHCSGLGHVFGKGFNINKREELVDAKAGS